MTFSIAARCTQTGMFGVAVCSSSPAVGARCAFARAGVGAAASQNLTDPVLGEALLDAMAAGLGADAAMARLAGGRADIQYRQLIAVDADGGSAVFSGAHVLGVHGAARALGVAAAGNLLASAAVPEVMVAAFQVAPGVLGARLLAAMRAAAEAGGEAGPVHSIGMKIVDRLSWPLIDLRVDWVETEPVDQLHRLWEVYAPQAEAYVARALHPGGAPSFGVAGEP